MEINTDMDEATIVSDFHLGSNVCQAKPLTHFLHHIKRRTKKLILNGDVFDNLDFRRLTKWHWHVLSQLRKASDDIEMIWLAGNHDGPAEIVSHLLGMEVRQEYVLETGGKKLLVLHGDKFDNFLDEHPLLSWFGDTIYALLQKIDKSHYFARVAKHNSKRYLRCDEHIKTEAVKYAKSLGCEMVCCGHSHNAVEDTPYFNSGCWTEKKCTFLTVNDGVVKLHAFMDESQKEPGGNPGPSDL